MALCFKLPKLTLSMHLLGLRNSSRILASVFFVWDSHRIIDKPTYQHVYIYISREISIEQPSVGLALLAQLFCVGKKYCIVPYFPTFCIMYTNLCGSTSVYVCLSWFVFV